jgi:hypothetical protein
MNGTVSAGFPRQNVPTLPICKRPYLSKRRRLDILGASIDGRSVLQVQRAAGLGCGCRRPVLYQQIIDFLGWRSRRRFDRVRQQGKRPGRPSLAPNVENATRERLSAGNGILKVAAMVGVGSGTV